MDFEVKRRKGTFKVPRIILIISTIVMAVLAVVVFAMLSNKGLLSGKYWGLYAGVTAAVTALGFIALIKK